MLPCCLKPRTAASVPHSLRLGVGLLGDYKTLRGNTQDPRNRSECSWLTARRLLSGQKGLPMRWMLVSLLLLTVAACGDSPTAPTSPPPPPPPPLPQPSASLQYTGNWSWENCGGNARVTCILQWSLTNVGPDCATQTTAVMRLYRGEDQIGADISMNAAGGLYNRTIRPNEIVALHSETRVDYNDFIQPATAANLFPTWTNVRC